VLASPTVDPFARSLVRLLLRWRLDARHEPDDLSHSHRPEWVRAGPRRLLHIVRAHLADRIEDVLGDAPFPVLVLRGREDRLLTAEWARELARTAPDGRFVEVPGAHTFVWPFPDAWSEPIRRLAIENA
jgi:pimeloyl-ACP methyl ester carboxylesterase